jgi:hypothetical protein
MSREGVVGKNAAGTRRPRDDEIVTDRTAAARATALRLVLAQINSDTDAIGLIERELLAADVLELERPHHLKDVAGVLIGMAAAATIQNHKGNLAAASKFTEDWLARTLDELDNPQA